MNTVYLFIYLGLPFYISILWFLESIACTLFDLCAFLLYLQLFKNIIYFLNSSSQLFTASDRNMIVFCVFVSYDFAKLTS